MSMLTNSCFAREDGLRIQMGRVYNQWNNYLDTTDKSSKTKTVEISIQVFPLHVEVKSNKPRIESNNIIYQSSVTHTIEIPEALALSARCTYLAVKNAALKEAFLDKIRDLWKAEIEEKIAALPKETVFDGETYSMTHVGVKSTIIFTRYTENNEEVAHTFNSTQSLQNGEIYCRSGKGAVTYNIVAL